MVVSFKISKMFTRVGVILFSNRARRIFGFNTYSRKRDILRAIDNIRYPRSGTRTGWALSYTRQTLFRSRSKVRKQVLVVMTDGGSQDSVSGPALALKRLGIEIFAVGIGKGYKIGQLLQIASSKRNVYIAGFRNLPSIVKVIKTKACSGIMFISFINTSLFFLIQIAILQPCVWQYQRLNFFVQCFRQHFLSWLCRVFDDGRQPKSTNYVGFVKRFNLPSQLKLAAFYKFYLNHRTGYFISFSELTISVCPFISGAGRPGGNTRPARK